MSKHCINLFTMGLLDVFVIFSNLVLASWSKSCPANNHVRVSSSSLTSSASSIWQDTCSSGDDAVLSTSTFLSFCSFCSFFLLLFILSVDVDGLSIFTGSPPLFLFLFWLAELGIRNLEPLDGEVGWDVSGVFSVVLLHLEQE